MSIFSNPSTISDFRRIGKKRLGCTPEEAKAKHDRRQESKNPSPDYRKTLLPLHLGFRLPKSIIDNRKKNYRTPKPTFKKSRLAEIDCGRYSSRCTYKKWEYQQYVQSWAKWINPSVIFVQIDMEDGLKNKVIYSPRGWSFQYDSNGIKLVKNSDNRIECHIDTMILKTSQNFIDTAKKLHKLRLENKKQEAELNKEKKRTLGYIKQAENEGLMICLRDSYSAGNCEVGTRNFVNRLGLTGTHCKPSTLLSFESKLDKETYRRVSSVILSAIRRHREEMNRGYAEISYHNS